MILTKASKLGLYALTEMALRPGELVSASAIATRFGVSENHIGKVLQQLARGELVTSTRGVGGGYQLTRAASEITMADVVRCIEGPMPTDGCADCPFRELKDACGADVASCNVHTLLDELNSQVHYTLESVTIATLARSKPTLKKPG
jgi:Rrf2 family protein